jgi:hypothetical protein
LRRRKNLVGAAQKKKNLSDWLKEKIKTLAENFF